MQLQGGTSESGQQKHFHAEQALKPNSGVPLMGVRLRGTFECAWLRFSFVSTAAPPTTTVGTGEMAIKTNLARRN